MNIVFFHKDCNDGLCGALAARLHFDGNAEYIPMTYKDNIDSYDLNDKTIYFIDISPPDSFFKKDKVWKEIIILDHHLSAIRNLSAFKDQFSNKSILDTKRSGATIAWEYFHPHLPIPRFIKIAEDRDLWKFNYPETKALTTYCHNFVPYTIESYLEIFDNDFILDDYIKKGKNILEYQSKVIQDVAERGTHILKFNFDGVEYDFGIINCMVFPSELGSYIVSNRFNDDIQPQVAIMWCYNMKDDVYNFSIRGRDIVDCSKIAEMIKQSSKNQNHRGGGHFNASGACSTEHPKDIFKN